jgi:hypothetical protein
VVQHTADECATNRRQTQRTIGVMQRVTVASPQAQVHVAATASLIGERLWRKRGDQPVLVRHRTNRLARRDLPICCLEERCMLNRQLRQ